MNIWTNKMLDRFDRWFSEKDLGDLEPHRATIRAYSLDNATDVKSIDAVQCAKATVEYYLDGGFEEQLS